MMPGVSLLETVKPSIDSWNSGDLDASLNLAHPEIVWRTASVFPDLDPVYYGHDGLRKFWTGFMDPWEEIRIHVDEVLGESGTAEDGVLVLKVRFTARGRDGVEVNLEVFQVFNVRGGLVTEFRPFLDAGEALEAAGLG